MAKKDSAAKRDTTAMDHAGHAAPTKAAAPAAVDHAAMGHVAAPATGAAATSTMAAAELNMRLLMDPVVRQRIVADTATRRMMLDAARMAPAEHRAHLESMLTLPAPPAPARAARTSRPARSTSVGQRLTAPAKKPAGSARKPVAKPAPVAKKPAPVVDHSKHAMPPTGKP